MKLLEKNLNTPEEIENNNVAINQWKNISFTNILLKIKNQEQVLCQWGKGGEKSTKFLLNLEKARAAKNTINGRK